jgi:hypothetical protein
VRALLLEQGQPVELHLFRDRALDPGPRLGDIMAARIAAKSARRAWLELGDGQPALIEPAPPQPEGARLLVEIIREAIPEPGGVKSAKARVAEPEAVPLTVDPLQRWLASLGQAEIVVTAPSAAAALAGLPQRLTVDPARTLDAALPDDPLDWLTDPVAFPGGTLTLERTAIGLVIDINGEGDPLALDISAARACARLLRLAQVAGSVTIDFLGLGSKVERQQVADAFDAASAADPRAFERTAINGFGHMQVVRSRQAPALFDQLCGTQRAAPSSLTAALAALRAVTRSAGVGPRQLRVVPAVAALLEAPAWRAILGQVERQVGAPVAVVADFSAPRYGLVHVAPR